MDQKQEMASARAAIDLDVDCLLGGTRAQEVAELIRYHPIRYYPFAGSISGHPSVLEGTEQEIVASARRLADLEFVHGLDLLAYRYAGDVPSLMRRVCRAVAKPVIMAGSIDREERVLAAAEAGAAGFTVGTAALAETFPAEGPGSLPRYGRSRRSRDAREPGRRPRGGLQSSRTIVGRHISGLGYCDMPRPCRGSV